MRRVLASLLAGLMLVSPWELASAGTWSVAINGTVGGDALETGFQVQLQDPVGGATVNVSGVPVTVSKSADAFGIATSLTAPTGPCVIGIQAQGSASIASGGGRTVAGGDLTGTMSRTCQSFGLPPIVGGNFPPFTEVLVTLAFVARLLGSADWAFAAVVLGVFLDTLFGLQSVAPGRVVEPNSSIRTGVGSGVTLVNEDLSRLSVGDQTHIALGRWANMLGGTVNLFGGRIDLQSGLSGGYETSIWTPNAWIVPTGTRISTRYSQDGLTGTTTVTVEEGSARVTDRQGNVTTLNAPAERSFTDTVNRVTAILPTDQGTVTMGRVNTFQWTSYPGAQGYLIEFTLNPAGFAQPNTPAPQPGNPTLRAAVGAYTEGEGVARFPLNVPAGVVPAGTVAHYRVIPTDAGGAPLVGAVFSDAVTVTLQ